MSNSLLVLIWVQKGVLSLVAIIFCMVLTMQGHIESGEALDFCKWILAAWLISQGAEDVASHLSGNRAMLLKRFVTEDPKKAP